MNDRRGFEVELNRATCALVRTVAFSMTRSRFRASCIVASPVKVVPVVCAALPTAVSVYCFVAA